MSTDWWKKGEPRTRSQPTLLVSPGDFTNRRLKSSIVEKSPIDSTRPLRRSSPRSRSLRSPFVAVSKRKSAKMPVKRSPQKPRTPQGQLIDVEGGETEAEMENIASENAQMLQRELQTFLSSLLEVNFSPPPHRLWVPLPVTVTVTVPPPVTVTEPLLVTVMVTVTVLKPDRTVQYQKSLFQRERQKLCKERE
jgi:hypothetical protein